MTTLTRTCRTSYARWRVTQGRTERELIEVVFRSGKRYLLALTPDQAAQVRKTA